MIMQRVRICLEVARPVCMTYVVKLDWQKYTVQYAQQSPI